MLNSSASNYFKYLYKF